MNTITNAENTVANKSDFFNQIPKITLERFWIKVSKSPHPKNCWIWRAASRNKKGYGVFFFLEKDTGAHRVSWMIHRGIIPNGLHVLHKCDNPACVNPAHLFLGTNDDNVMDKVRKNRQAKGIRLNRKNIPSGESHANSKLTEIQVIEIRKKYQSGLLLQTDIARAFRVTNQCICRIVNRISWRHI